MTAESSPTITSGVRWHDRRVPRLVPPVIASTDWPDVQPALTTGTGLLLRPWRMHDEADVAAVLAAYADPGIQRWGVRDIPDAQEAQTWIAGWAAGWEERTDACWAVEQDGETVGRIALRRLDAVGGTGEVAYWVVPSARGHGVASSASAEVTRWAFEELGLHRLELCHSVRNEASCAVARRIGFALEGTLRDGMLHADGWHDMHLHARLVTDRGSAVTPGDAATATRVSVR